MSTGSRIGSVRDLRCSFCGLARQQVKVLISGPQVFICESCVSLCLEILVHQDAEPQRVPITDILQRQQAEIARLRSALAHAHKTLGDLLAIPAESASPAPAVGGAR